MRAIATAYLSRVESNNERILVETIDLVEKENGIYSTSFGILANGYYVVDIEVESIYRNIEIRNGISEFSVGSN